QFGLPLLTFVNRSGQTSSGRWLNPTTVAAIGWNSIGTVANGQIIWNGGTSVWSQTLTVQGTGTGPGVVSITVPGNAVILTNRQGQMSQATITGPNTIVTGPNWGSVVGTRTNGKIHWANGTVWENFDFNALNALFADLRDFPFGI